MLVALGNRALLEHSLGQDIKLQVKTRTPPPPPPKKGTVCSLFILDQIVFFPTVHNFFIPEIISVHSFFTCTVKSFQKLLKNFTT